MSDVLVLGADQTRSILARVDLSDACATALIELSRGGVSAPARGVALTPDGAMLGSMPGYVPGLGLAAKLVTMSPVPGRPGRSLHNGVVAQFDVEDGRLTALVDAQSITAVRTAMAATLAMRAIGPANPTKIAVVGSGVQARAQIELLTEVACPVVVGARDASAAGRLAELHPQGSVDTIEAAVRGADVVLCCTGASSPVVDRSWLADGVYVSSVGGSHGCPELDAETIADASVCAEWPGSVTEPPPVGAPELQGLDPSEVISLGALLDPSDPQSVMEPGAAITVFKSTGHAALDVAAASVVVAFARENGIGVTIPF
ncbi:MULTISPECIES: ornithine cyclodeaminase family protein [Pseudonocardia]|uniref:ornithine cyclodeaminase family protein n=1 Tax=Pseudonocardia TaxID=1847 RepID=UPI001302AA93|nr:MULTISPECIES: ornithine cyclodeaminase family protein [Pseudonocardia]